MGVTLLLDVNVFKMKSIFIDIEIKVIYYKYLSAQINRRFTYLYHASYPDPQIYKLYRMLGLLKSSLLIGPIRYRPRPEWIIYLH